MAVSRRLFLGGAGAAAGGVALIGEAHPAEGLACVFRASLDTDRLSRTLGLSETQFIMFSQTVGYPKG